MSKAEVIEALKIIGTAVLVAFAAWILLIAVLSLGGST